MLSNHTAAMPPAHPIASGGLWKIYDELMVSIDPAARVDAFAAGLHWFGVRSSEGMGLAMAPPEGRAAPTGAGKIAGRGLSEIAQRAKSWNFSDAALGVAAINAHHNAPERVRPLLDDPRYTTHTGTNAFEYMLPRVIGKRVTVIGHFRGLDKMAEHCELTILERRPQVGDLPDPACEDVLPRSDFVFITGTTLINKTLPRLLALSRGAFVSLVGPTTPLTPRWFDLGVNLIAGLVVDDVPAVWPIVQEGGQHSFFDSGTRMLQVERKGVANGRSGV
jgi:uncharacterized protein (DUF4213/DUF364 family)